MVIFWFEGGATAEAESALLLGGSLKERAFWAGRIC